MTEEVIPKKKKRRRRNRRRRSGGGQGSPQQQNQAVHSPNNIYDEHQEKRAMKAVEKQQQNKSQIIQGIVEQLIPLALPPRDLEVFEWLVRATGKTSGEIIIQMVRSAVIRERVGFREAKGGGGSSSTDLERLANRI